MGIETEEEIEAFIEQMLDESLAGFEKITTARELEIIRSSLRDELLFHPAGQERVRRAMSDTSVERSGKVAKRTEQTDANVTPLRRKGQRS